MIEIERRFSVTEVTQIEIRTGMGDISASTSNGQAILVRARIRSGNEAELEATVVDGVLVVNQRTNGKNGQPDDWHRSSSMDVTLVLPAGSEVSVALQTGKGDVSSDRIPGLRDVRTGKGDVSTSRSVRDLAIQTGMGDVSVRNASGAVLVETGKGDVSIGDLAGGLQVRTGAGDVSVHGWQAPAAATTGAKHAIRTGAGDVSVSRAQSPSLDVNTGRGDCSLDQVALTDLHVHSGSGDVSVDGDPATGRWEVRTGKGDLSMRIPARAVRIEAATRHGDISSDLPQVKVARPGPASQRGGRSIGVIGGEPRAEILLETSHGDISVRVAGAPLPLPAASAWTSAIAEPVAVPVLPTAQTSLAVPPSDPKATALAVLESLSRGELTVDEAEALLRSIESA